MKAPVLVVEDRRSLALMLLETLQRGFKQAKLRLTGKAELTEDNVDEALREVRLSLLEADVEFKVVKDEFIVR